MDKNARELSTILKLNKIFKLGYLPSRGDESYEEEHLHSGARLSVFANCFEHACFNLKNSHLQGFTVEDADSFGHKIDYLGQPKEEIAKNLLDFLKASGLQIKRVFRNFTTKTNQWLVALYFGTSLKDNQNQDFHFMRKESNDLWSHKMGHTDEIEYLNKPPLHFISNSFYKYKLYGYFIITNPYVEIMEEKETSL